jgi:hypothetical protein
MRKRFALYRGLVEGRKVQYKWQWVLASLSPKLETGGKTIMEESNDLRLLFPTTKEYHFRSIQSVQNELSLQNPMLLLPEVSSRDSLTLIDQSRAA